MSEVVTIKAPRGYVILESDTTTYGHLVYILPETVQRHFDEMSEESKDRLLQLCNEYLGGVLIGFEKIFTQFDYVAQRKS